ncbi:hypothetical protein HY227_01960 [Candidatus Wolfebacteria bacterium]|nr:hypothetical protein [Candidatus Wolfebacteria bacterium]
MGKYLGKKRIFLKIGVWFGGFVIFVFLLIGFWGISRTWKWDLASAMTFDADVVPGGSYTFNLGASALPWQRIFMSDGMASNPSYSFGSSPNVGIFSPSSNTLGFSTNSAERMRILGSNGFVGIGTSTPTSTLDVIGTLKATGFYLGTSATAGYVLTATTTGTGFGAWQPGSAGTLQSGTSTGDTLYWDSSSAKWNPNNFLFDNVGVGVGIGTSTLQSVLTLAGGGITIDRVLQMNQANERVPMGNTSTTIEFNNNNAAFGGEIIIGIDGLPIIVYSKYINDNQKDLKIAHCNDIKCSSFSINGPLDAATSVSTYTDIDIAIGKDGLPIIAYSVSSAPASSTIKVVSCANYSCSSTSSIYSIGAGFPTIAISMVIGNDGYPVITYNSNLSDLKLVHCTSINCSTYDSPLTLDAGGSSPSISIGSDGFPIIAYYYFNSADFRVFHCTNINCSANDGPQNIVTTGNSGQSPSITIGSDGLPIISWYRAYNTNLYVTHCGNVGCSAGNTNTAIEDVTGINSKNSSIAIGANGLPVVAYLYNWFSNNNYLKFLYCGNTDCSSGNIIITPEGGPSGPWWIGNVISLAIGIDGLPVLFKDNHDYSSNNNESFYINHCGSVYCLPYWTRR